MEKKYCSICEKFTDAKDYHEYCCKKCHYEIFMFNRLDNLQQEYNNVCMMILHFEHDYLRKKASKAYSRRYQEIHKKSIRLSRMRKKAFLNAHI